MFFSASSDYYSTSYGEWMMWDDEQKHVGFRQQNECGMDNGQQAKPNE